MADYFYNAIRRDITMIQNDTLSFAFQVQGLKGQTPNNIVFTCKETIETSNDLFSVDLSNNITLRDYDEDQDIYTYVVRIPPALTEEVALGRYFYDLQVTVNYDIFTLMKGRLTIEYQVTGGSVMPEPQYESGDDVLYPRSDIPVGTVKLYTEEYVNELIRKIQELNDSLDQVTISGASQVADEIQDQITEISDTIKEVTGSTSTDNIPISQMASAINNIPTVDKEPKIELAFNSNDYNTSTETYTVTEDGYYLVVVSSGAGNGDAVDITLPQGIQADYSNKFMLSAAWYGAVYIIVAHLTTGDTVSMTVGTNTYSVTARKTVFKLVNFPDITQLLSNSLKTDGVENNISTDITLPSSGKALIIAGCNGRELRYSFETGTECGYSFLTSGIGGRTIPYTGFLRVGYFEVDNLPYLTTSAADGGLSWLIALGEEA